jgi:dTDP-4-amino-4,6-dideoxygalactose transaminase
MGPEVQAFEEQFAKMQRAKHAFAVANATAGLHLAFLSLGLGPGDEVIQPALNFVAAANMTVAVGATPVFADILSLSEPTLDPKRVERLITRRTKAVVVMHYGGNLCRMASFVNLCKERGLALIEDACHAVGATYQDPEQRPPDGVMAGSIGDISAFSFFANKNLAAGEGGMVVTNRDDVADRIKLLRSHGMTTVTWDRHQGHAASYDVLANGYNYRLDELHAALGRVQLSKLAANNERRRELARLYWDQLRCLEAQGWILPFRERPKPDPKPRDASSACHLFILVAPDSERRRRSAETLKAAGVQTSLHYPCIPDFSTFAQHGGAELEISREFSGREISLPMFPAMTKAQVQDVCKVTLCGT